MRRLFLRIRVYLHEHLHGRMDHHNNIIALIALLFAAAAFFAVGYMSARHRYDMPVDGRDTVFVEKWVRDTVYEPRDSFIVRWRTVYLPVHDTSYVRDTTSAIDTVLVEVPITEKTYSGENYRAVVRGFQPELVDIWFKQKETTISVPYKKRWSVSVGPQAGFGFTPGGWQPYAGVGVSFGYSF